MPMIRGIIGPRHSGVSVNGDHGAPEPATIAVDDYGWHAAAPHSSGYLNRPVRAIVAEGGLKDVLYAGCGNGALAVELAADGHRVVGIDMDARGLEFARSRAPGVTFVQASFEGDPAALRATPDGRFDVVVSTEVIEHLYAPHALAAYAYAALRPGGRLVITTPYHGYLKNLALSLLDGWDRHFSVDWHGGHIKFWSRRTLALLLEKQGFRLVGFRGVGRVPYLWKSMILIAERPSS